MPEWLQWTLAIGGLLVVWFGIGFALACWHQKDPWGGY